MRRDVQKNKNKQKQELKNKNIESQKGIYSSNDAYMNITTINLNGKHIEFDLKLPFNFILRDATEISKHQITYLCRASDMLILTITGVEVDLEIVNLIKRSMPSVVIVHDKKLKSFARTVSKHFGAPKICDFSMLSVALKNIKCENTTIAKERPFMVPMEAAHIDGLLTVKGFMKNGLRSDKVIINGIYEGIIEEVEVDGSILNGNVLNIENDSGLYERCYSENEHIGDDEKNSGDDVNSEHNEEYNAYSEENNEENSGHNEENNEENSAYNEDNSEHNEEYNEENSDNYNDENNNVDDLIEKYSKYKGIRDLSSCTFKDQLEEMPEYYKNLIFMKSMKHTLNKIKHRETVIPKNKTVILKIRAKLPEDIINSPLVIFNLCEYETETTILNYEFTSPTFIPKNICVDNGFRIFKTQCIVTRNLNNTVFKEEKELNSGIVSFIAPLVLFGSNAFIIPDDPNSTETIKLFNGYSQNRIFFDCVKLLGKPVKICKSYAVIKGMFFTKEQVEYFSNIKVEAHNGVQGFIKKPLGTKGAFKAYFAKTVKYGESISMPLYKRAFL